ncbi:hypothetical protein KR51_00021580 [Rubidibacter lacunae KORDI 51-2]|uniref:Uncharacterized protein n=1 Tax=Rubidibacter lacunae KORDI 51-2 TaxID=582515 RepID=U5D9K0_9CHRO|nr:hypothetical protein KR51_00021580 [Rubidibacter lacunae KORDI 51-2]
MPHEDIPVHRVHQRSGLHTISQTTQHQPTESATYKYDTKAASSLAEPVGVTTAASVLPTQSAKCSCPGEGRLLEIFPKLSGVRTSAARSSNSSLLAKELPTLLDTLAPADNGVEAKKSRSLQKRGTEAIACHVSEFPEGVRCVEVTLVPPSLLTSSDLCVTP